MKQTATPRGFAKYEFSDHAGVLCSLQKSSLNEEECVWLGVNDTTPQILVKSAHQHGIDTTGYADEESNGWMPYPLPDDVFISSRMLLTRQQAQELIEKLKPFVETGELL